VVAVINASVDLVLRLVGQRDSTAPVVTEEDILDLVREGIASGTVEAGQEELVQRVFRFNDRPVSAVMTPRSGIKAVNVGMTRAEVLQRFADAGHSRLPLYEDAGETIAGVLHAKDVLQTLLGGERVDLKQLARKPFFVSENHYADELLTQFRQTGVHLAFVRDEKSGTYTTLAEFILAHLERMPAVGEVVTIGDVTLEVVDMDGRRIDRVLISCQQ
jgi:putative hemolysin